MEKWISFPQAKCPQPRFRERDLHGLYTIHISRATRNLSLRQSYLFDAEQNVNKNRLAHITSWQ